MTVTPIHHANIPNLKVTGLDDIAPVIRRPNEVRIAVKLNRSPTVFEVEAAKSAPLDLREDHDTIDTVIKPGHLRAEIERIRLHLHAITVSAANLENAYDQSALAVEEELRDITFE